MEVTMRYPDKRPHQNTPAQHLIFIRNLSCCRCGKHPSLAYQFEGSPIDALPICADCLEGIHGGWTIFADDNQSIGRQLAHNLWLLSGNIYGGVMTVLKQQGKIFL